MSKLIQGGVSTTTENGQFAYEEYFSAVRSCWRVQWDYRDLQGKLHSGVADSVEDAKETVARQFGYVGAAEPSKAAIQEAKKRS